MIQLTTDSIHYFVCWPLCFRCLLILMSFILMLIAIRSINGNCEMVRSPKVNKGVWSIFTPRPRNLNYKHNFFPMKKWKCNATEVCHWVLWMIWLLEMLMLMLSYWECVNEKLATLTAVWMAYCSVNIGLSDKK